MWIVYKIEFSSGKEFINIAQDWKWTDIVDYCSGAYKTMDRITKIGEYNDYKLANQVKKENYGEYKPKQKFSYRDRLSKVII